MRTVGGDEVDQRFRVFHVLHEIGPARVGGQLAVAGHVVELAPRRVQRRDAGFAATRQVECGKVERQADQVVAQSVSDKLVDLVADLPCDTAHDGACRLLRSRAAVSKRQRVEEGRDQAGLLIARVNRIAIADDVEVGVESIDRLQQHRMAEAKDRVRELGDDRRIDGGVVAHRGQEHVHLRLDGARELLEHQVLVLHFGAELGGLEQPLAVPVQTRDVGRRHGQRCQLGVGHQPLVQEIKIGGSQHRLLGLLNQPVVLAVENGMHSGQADVLVNAAITGDVVLVEQLVVVGARCLRAADDGVRVSRQAAGGVGAVGDVDEELVAGANGVRQADRRGPVTLDEHVIGSAGDAVHALHHDLGETVGALDEVAVGIGRQQRYIEHVRIGQVDAEQITGLGLDDCPGGHAADFDVIGRTEMPINAQVTIGDQLAGGDRITGGIELIGAQEHLVRGVRAVGLVLVDKRRGGVALLVDVIGGAQDAVGTGQIGGARQHHEVGRAARHEKRVIRLQRNEHGTAAALGHEVKAMVEELAKERHPLVERHGQARVRRDVGDLEDGNVVGGAEQAIQTGAGDDL
ncbi:hypothetical protein BSF40_60330 [Pseudomonas sp. ACN5]|nr:hypothetical protein BSF40_60330 [Pseudomonas sp. ACN5]